MAYSTTTLLFFSCLSLALLSVGFIHTIWYRRFRLWVWHLGLLRIIEKEMKKVKK
jgi:hypothetical protein